MIATPTLAVILLLTIFSAAAAAAECASGNGDHAADAITAPLTSICEAQSEAPALTAALPEAPAINDTDIENPKSGMAIAVVISTALLLVVSLICSCSWRQSIEAGNGDWICCNQLGPLKTPPESRPYIIQNQLGPLKTPPESRPYIIHKATKVDTRGNPSTDNYAELYRVELKHEVHGDYSLTVFYSHAEETAKLWIQEVRHSLRIHGKILIALCYYRGLQLEKHIPEPVQLLSLCASDDSCFIAPLTPYGRHKMQRHSLPVAIISFLNSSEVQIVGMDLEQLSQKLFTQCGAAIPLGIGLSREVNVPGVREPKDLETMVKACKGWVFKRNQEKFRSGVWTGSFKNLDEITCAARDAFISFKVAAETLGVSRKGIRVPNVKEAAPDDGGKAARGQGRNENGLVEGAEYTDGIRKKGKAGRGKKPEGESSNSRGRYRV